MAIISSYDNRAGLKGTDRLLGTEDGIRPSTKNFSIESLTNYALTQDLPIDWAKQTDSGFTRTNAFAARPADNGYQYAGLNGIDYTQADADAGTFKVFGFDYDAHLALDNPWWTENPTPSGQTGIGLFQGGNLPAGTTSLIDYTYNFDNNYDPNGSTGFEGSTGRIKLNECQYGDLLLVRFDYNIIPMIENTTVEPALWFSNRDDQDNITATFPLTETPSTFVAGSPGNVYLQRPLLTAWIANDGDVNALCLPAIKADNPVIIQPLGALIIILR